MAKSRGYKAHSNRTDLNTALPVTTVPGQAYGVAGQQAAAQQAVPMASGPPPVQVAQQQQQAGAPGPLPQAGPATSALPLPGGMPPIMSPSDRPNEPVTHGAPMGAGAGPEALMGFQTTKVSQTIAQIAQASGNPDLLRLAQHAQSQGN